MLQDFLVNLNEHFLGRMCWLYHYCFLTLLIGTTYGFTIPCDGKKILFASISDYSHIKPILSLGIQLHEKGCFISLASDEAAFIHKESHDFPIFKVGKRFPSGLFGKNNTFNFASFRKSNEEFLFPTTESYFLGVSEVLSSQVQITASV